MTSISNSLLDAMTGPPVDPELAHLQAGPVVHAKNRIARKALEQPVIDHSLRAGTAFLGRLEDKVHRAIDRFRFGQVFRRRQQHRHVPIVSARVHLAGVRRTMRKFIGLLNRQCVHIGAQTDGAL